MKKLVLLRSVNLKSTILLVGMVFANIVFISACGAVQTGSGGTACPSLDRTLNCSVTLPKQESVRYKCSLSLEATPLILQNPELPNGCEVTSLAMLLSSTGIQADKMELYSEYLPQEQIFSQEGTLFGPNPSEVYVGDASSSLGWYCFEAPILSAGNAWLERQELPWQMKSDTGLEQIQLQQYLEQGIPLIVWVTLDYQEPRTSDYTWYLPDGTVYTPYSNLHCVVLTGWDGENYQVADPISGWQTVSLKDFWYAFDTMGRRVVTITPKAQL